MPTFVYEVRDATGQLRRDTIEAQNVRVATARLQEQKMTVISIKEKAAGAGAEGLAGLLQKMRKVNEQALTVFSRQFATMINAGLAMVREWSRALCRRSLRDGPGRSTADAVGP